MALISCPECGHQISSLSRSCPNCGRPNENPQENMCLIEGVQYDLSEILMIAKDGDGPHNLLKAWEKIETITGLKSVNPSKLFDIILDTQSIPKEFKPWKREEANNIPKCPTCGSTKLQKLGIGTRAIDGFFFGRMSPEARAQFWCRNCDYRF